MAHGLRGDPAKPGSGSPSPAREAPHVLIVAGSDSSGGAGIVRDVEAVAAFCLKACVAVTAVTAQTHDKVWSVTPVPADTVAEQMWAALAANPVRAIKLGMLGNAAIAEEVANVLADHPDIPVVLDPVLVSSSGAILLEPAGIEVLLHRLLPVCALITPNLPELAVLAGTATNSSSDIEKAAARLFSLGARAVLAKGGHAEGAEAVDALYSNGQQTLTFSGRRYPGTLRGTGCMLSSAIAAGLAQALTLETAVAKAKSYLTRKFMESI